MYAVADLLLEVELADDDGDGYHDLRSGIEAFLYQFGSSVEDSAELCLAYLGVCDTQTYSAVSHHGVDLMQALAAFFNIVNAYAQLFGQFSLFLGSLRHELMERRVEQTESNGLAVHYLQGILYGLLDVRLQFSQSGLSLFVGLGEYHFPELGQRCL